MMIRFSHATVGKVEGKDNVAQWMEEEDEHGIPQGEMGETALNLRRA